MIVVEKPHVVPLGLSPRVGEFKEEPGSAAFFPSRESWLCARPLRELLAEHVLFTPALMYLGVRLMGRQPLYDYQLETKKILTLSRLAFGDPLFVGLQSSDDEVGVYWNHVLFSLPKHQWTDFSDWLSTLGFWDPDRRRLTRIGVTPISIYDPYWKNRPIPEGETGQVPVTIFCLDDSRGIIFLSPPQVPGDLPRLTLVPPLSGTVRFLKALEDEADDPLGVAEQAESSGGLSAEEAELRFRLTKHKQLKK